jgi:hypothetical protein
LPGEEHEVEIYGKQFVAEVHRRVSTPIDVPRLLIPAFAPNEAVFEVLESAITAIVALTAAPYELWVVDNGSPPHLRQKLLQIPDINVVLRNRPRGPRSLLRGWLERKKPVDGSMENAIGLEIALEMIDPSSRYVMSLHQDVMPSHPAWLGFLLGKLEGGAAAAGVRMDTARVPEGILHVLGMLIDYTLFRELGLSFEPDLPRLDVGDRVTVELRRAGHRVFACRNTLWDDEARALISPDSPFHDIPVDRAFDDDGEVIFLHLGRSVRKGEGTASRGLSPGEWSALCRESILPLNEGRTNS